MLSLLYPSVSSFFFFNDTATTEIYTLSLHGRSSDLPERRRRAKRGGDACVRAGRVRVLSRSRMRDRSEEHTSELQSPCNLVCRLLLEKKKKRNETDALRTESRPEETHARQH